MQVQLKQSELVSAVRQYLTQQGISLNGKDVDVKFSATRGDAGIVAMIDIDDAANDGLVITPTERPTLQVVSPIVTAEEQPVIAGSDIEQPGGTEKKTSLFNS